MKFSNSTPYNTQHFIVATCILAISLAAMFIAISNEPCHQPLSAKQVLHRRLFDTPKQKRAGALAKIKNLEETFNEKIQAELETLEQTPVDETLFEKDSVKGFFQHKAAKWTAITSIAVPFISFIAVAIMKSSEGQTFYASGLGGVCSLCITFGILIFYLQFISSRGEWISQRFGSMGDGAIVASTLLVGCVGALGSSAAFAAGISHATIVFGAASLGVAFSLLFFWALKPSVIAGRKSQIGTYIGVSCLSVGMAVGFGLSFFGYAHQYCLGVIGVTLVTALFWFGFKKCFSKY